MLALLFGWGQLYAQEGTLKGKVYDAETKEPLPFAKITLKGTYYGALSDGDGNFVIKGIKPGDYSVVFFMDEYKSTIYTGQTIIAGQTTTLNGAMKSASYTLETFEIIGQAELVDLETGQSKVNVTKEFIQESSYRDVAEIVSNQNGVNLTPDGVQIRGGRVYETTYLVEGISAKDPLAGTGLGVNVSASSIEELDLVTGGGDAEFGNGTAGVINTRIREGGDKIRFRASWQRDNLGFNPYGAASWNTDVGSASFSGPVPGTKGKVSFFTSADVSLTDTYFGEYARQLHSSLFTNDSMWAPRQDNQWANTIKLTYNIRPGMKLSVTNQHSLNINQNSRTLQIVGNDAILRPGFPYRYSLNLDNANTYTHHSNLTIANFKTVLDSSRWTLDVSLGRLFTVLQADANGRPFRESTVDRINDPASIVTDPVDVFNPDDSVVYVFPGPGLFNNDGLGTLWHNHHAQEYTVRYKFSHQSKSGVHFLSFGHEHKEQEYQWIDVTRPWVGAPIVINDSLSTPSTSIGSSSDVWLARPAQGGIFFQDEIRYKGIIAFLGARFDYWAPGKFADNAVEDPEAPVVDEVREQYREQTTPLLGKRWKARLLPKVRVSFPVTDNNVLYFNYGHATLLPHPRFVYAGLDPVYQDRSFLSNLGNPNINPEVTVSYEIGLKSKINKNLALTVTAFYNDKFDYIVSRRILIKDRTGRFVEKTFFINQDYARIRGIEVGVRQRIARIFQLNLNGAYQIATGKSNTAAESALQIRQQGFVNTSKENFLAWDRPFDFKGQFVFKPDSTVRLFGVKLEGFRAFLSANLQSGLRYTPFVLVDTSDLGRPLWEPDIDRPFEEIGAWWFWTDLKITRDFRFGAQKQQRASIFFEVRNLFNNKNSQIINGVTGRAYQDGDPLPASFRDPNYPDPQDRGLPPFNPARFMTPRQVMFGISMSL
jgi:outer membrane receptor protein involved in Fe transport